jgi:protein gp37
MAIGSSIEWTEATWNPVAGCTVLSPGCTNCYAMRMASRLESMGQDKYTGVTRVSGGRPKWNGRINLDEASLMVPRSWKTGRMIFVNSMSDLFHEAVPLDFIKRVFSTMNECPQHTFQVLTKRSERLLELGEHLRWSSNIWMGVSVESEEFTDRIEHLRNVPAVVRFLSCEPLLGPLNELNLTSIDWVIAGGESGPGSRPVRPEWISSIRDQCLVAKTAFHFKQWGGVNKKKSGRLLDGRTWDEFPKLEVVAQ